MKILVGLVFALSLCLSGAENKKDESITFEGVMVPAIPFEWELVEVVDEWTFTPDLQSNPHDCASNRFQFNGSNFICLQVDRLNIIRAQRDYHYATEQWYQRQIIAKDAYSILDELQRIAREKCRKQGKRFSEQDADCVGSIGLLAKEEKE